MHKKSEPLTRITFSSEPLKPIEQIEFFFDVNIEPVPRPRNEHKYPPIIESSFEFEASVKEDPALDIYKQEVKLLHELYRRIRRRN